MRYAVVALVSVVLTTASPAFGLTRCDLTYTLEGWSVFYKEANGSGVVRCDNGQEARVVLETRGGGITFGRSKIVGGTGEFSPIADIDEIYGNYANAEAHAGMGVSSEAQVVTKGSVSLGLSGTGNGVDIGIAFGRFTIMRASPSARDDAPRDEPVREAPIRDEDLPPPAPPEAGY